MSLFRVEQLSKRYPIQCGVFKRTVGYTDIIQNITFSVPAGEILAIVGESGCGKSTLARMMMGLEKPSNGKIFYNNQRIDSLSYRQQMPIRRAIQMVFQDPSAALNPRFAVGKLLQEPLDIHQIGTKAERLQAVNAALESVELDADFSMRYPHELSGGQRQRVAIARSIILKPDVLFLDEPLSALDVSLQGQMLALFEKLRQTMQLTLVIISHDLGLVEDFSDRTLVLHYGEIAEYRKTAELFAEPEHPYTRQLLASIPNKLGKTRF